VDLTCSTSKFKIHQAVEKVVCTPGSYGGERAFWEAIRSKCSPALLWCSNLIFWNWASWALI